MEAAIHTAMEEVHLDLLASKSHSIRCVRFKSFAALVMIMLLMIIHTTHEALPCRVPLGRAVDRCFGKPPGSGNLPMPRPVCGVARGPFDGDPVSAEVGRARAFCASVCFQSHLSGVAIVCNLPRTCRGIYAAEAPGFAACPEETQIAVSVQEDHPQTVGPHSLDGDARRCLRRPCESPADQGVVKYYYRKARS